MAPADQIFCMISSATGGKSRSTNPSLGKLIDFRVGLNWGPRVFSICRASRSSKLLTKSKFRGLAEVQILEAVDEIQVRRPRGAPDRRNCRQHRPSEATRGSRSRRFSMTSRFSALAEFKSLSSIALGRSRFAFGDPVD